MTNRYEDDQPRPRVREFDASDLTPPPRARPAAGEIVERDFRPREEPRTEVSQRAVAAATGAPSSRDDDDQVVVFSRSYQAHGEPVSRVRFRKPTGRDVVECGYPFRLLQPERDGDQVEIKIIPQNVSKLIVALSDPPLPRSTVDAFEVQDWNACSRVVNGFFQS